MAFNRIFSGSYDFFMSFLEKKELKARRARLLSGLTGKILEVGVGTGVNFEHYNHSTNVTGIEPSPYMLVHADKKRDLLLFPDRITLHNTGCGTPEMQKLIEPGSLDAVVCTLVLCTIPEPQLAIENFMKWLKPGGQLLILEHIRSHNHKTAKFQDKINPLWEKIADGCQVNRPTDKMLASSGFILRRKEHFRLGIPFFEAEYIKADH
ncbi:MAG: class I SAM-dependent methyltransferase [Prolixibacteraceae bacterium]|nr:class I SAM-dependent methyltransferase [Prolixibacteraceae bacterium]